MGQPDTKTNYSHSIVNRGMRSPVDAEVARADTVTGTVKRTSLFSATSCS